MTDATLDQTANAETPATTPADDFSAAFADFVTKDNAENAPAVTADIVVEPKGDPADQTEFTDPSTTPVVDPAAEPVVDEPKPDPFERLADLIQGRQAQQPAQQPPQQQQPVEAPLFSPAEAAYLAEFEKDFPDVARAQTLQMRANNQVLVKHVFDQVTKAYQPYMEMLVDIAEGNHIANLRTAVPDYDDLRDKVISWVDTQPAYLKDAFGRVIENGSQEEVADLIARYKAANPAQAPAKAAPTPRKDTELPPAAKQAAAALAPVGSKRTAVVTGGIETQSFEDAFANFAKQA